MERKRILKAYVSMKVVSKLGILLWLLQTRISSVLIMLLQAYDFTAIILLQVSTLHTNINKAICFVYPCNTKLKNKLSLESNNGLKQLHYMLTIYCLILPPLLSKVPFLNDRKQIFHVFK
jgi:hypothetical protein